MDKSNFYFRQRVTNKELEQLSSFIEKADLDNVRELLGSGILSGGNVTALNPANSGKVQIEQTIARDSRGRRVNVIDSFGDTCSAIVHGLTLQLDGIPVPNTNGTYLLFNSKPSVEPFALIGQKLVLTRSKFKGNIGEFEIKQVVETTWNGLFVNQIMVRIDEELTQDGYQDGVSPKGTTTIAQIESGSTSKAIVTHNQANVDVRPTEVNRERWVSLYAEFSRNEFDARLDGNGEKVNYIALESFKYVVIEGVEADSGQAQKPNIIDDGKLFIADILLVHNADIEQERIDISRQSKMANLPATAGQIVEYVNTLFFGDKISWTGTNLSITEPIKISIPNKAFQYNIPVFDIAIADGEVLYLSIDRRATDSIDINPVKVTRGSVPQGSVDKLVIILAERSGQKIQGAYGGELEPGEIRDIGDSIGQAIFSFVGMDSEIDGAPDFSSTKFLKNEKSLLRSIKELDSILFDSQSNSSQDLSVKLVGGGVLGKAVYSAPRPEIQKIIYSNPPNAGSFTVRYGENTSQSIGFNESNASIQEKLRTDFAMSGLIISGDLNSGRIITFDGEQSGSDFTPLEIVDNSLLNNEEAVSLRVVTTQDGSPEVLRIPTSSRMFVQVPSVDSVRNIINPQNIDLAYIDHVAFVEINRTGVGEAILDVKYCHIKEFEASANRVIFARRVARNSAIIGDTLIIEGSSKALGSGISEEVKSLLGITGDNQTVIEWIKKRNISENDSLIEAVESIDTELDKVFGQLKIIKHEEKSKAIITGADKIMLDGSVLSQELQNLILKFDGAIIDFAQKRIFKSDGLTNLGLDFPTMANVQDGHYLWIGVALIPSDVTTDNRIEGQVLISPSIESSINENLAPLPAIAGSKKTGAILIFNNSGSLEVKQIRQFGTGSGSGGSGSGDASTLLGRLEDTLDDSNFLCLTPNIISVSGDKKLDSTTGRVNLVSQTLDLDDTQNFITEDLIDDDFKDQGIDILSSYVALAYESDVDSNPKVELSLNGVDYSTVEMSKVSPQGDTISGSIAFILNSFSKIKLREYSFANGDTKKILEAGKIYSQEFVATYEVLEQLKLKLTKTGSPEGYLAILIYKDANGEPGELTRQFTYPVSEILDGENVQNFDFGQIVLKKDEKYHFALELVSGYLESFDVDNNIKLETDNSAISIAPSKLYVENWVNESDAFVFEMHGRPFELKMRYTAGSSVKIKGYGVFYGELGSGVELNHNRRATFHIEDSENKITLPWIPDADFLEIYDAEVGQIWKSPSISIQGQIVQFPKDMFKGRGVLTLVASQPYQSTVDESDYVKNIIESNHLGSFDDELDKSVAGRGTIVKKPNGEKVEITISNDNSVILKDRDGVGQNLIESSRKNWLINSDMSINQRAFADNVDSAMPSGGWTVDRFKCYIANVNVVARRNTSGLPDGFSYSVSHKATSSGVGTIAHYQKVEFLSHFRGKTVTLSAWCKSNSSKARLYLYTGTQGNRHHISPETHKGDGEWQRLSFTYTLPDVDFDHLDADFGLIGENGEDIQINDGEFIEWTGQKLEEGDIATKYIKEDYQSNLLRCMRYFEKIDGTIYSCYAGGLTAGYAFVSWIFKVRKRAVPVIALTGGSYSIQSDAYKDLVKVKSAGAHYAVVASGSYADAEL